MPAVVTLLLRAALVAVLAGAVWHWAGLIPAVMVACLSAPLLARPIVELAGDARHALRAAALRDVQGRHYAYHGRPLRVSEDADHRRWIHVDDVRAIVGFTATDGALALSYPSGFRRVGRDAQLCDEALVLHLGREPGPAALKLRHWVEREILFPAQAVRRRLGIRVPAPAAPLDSPSHQETP